MPDLPPSRVPLRDGREVTLRAVTPADVQGMYDLGWAIHAAGEGIVRTAAEYVAHGVAYAKSSITDAPPGSIRIVADAGDGVLAGEVALWRAVEERLRHGATLGIGVHPGWQGVGLGRQLMVRALAWADAAPGLHRVQLEVFSTNVHAQALYASCGFAVEGRRVRAVRQPDGTWIDDVLMARFPPSA